MIFVLNRIWKGGKVYHLNTNHCVNNIFPIIIISGIQNMNGILKNVYVIFVNIFNHKQLKKK